MNYEIIFVKKVYHHQEGDDVLALNFEEVTIIVNCDVWDSTPLEPEPISEENFIIVEIIMLMQVYL